ncbi:MAG: hypothetical protein R6X19_05530 [Kiritimatiellia bacterium]
MRIPRMRWLDLGLVLVFVLVAGAITGLSYFDSEGCLFEDSTQYLKLAQSLVDGKGWVTTPCNFESDEGGAFFAVWPVGYPVMIALVSLLTGLSVFSASKAVSVILVALLILILRRSFGAAAVVCACTLMFAPFLEIFSFTMSEVPFVFGLVWFCVSLHAFMKRPGAPRALIIVASAFLVFSVRYIGIFTIGVCGLLALYYLGRREYRVMALVLVAVVLGVFLMGAYLFNNYRETGYITGMPRAPSFEPWQDKLAALAGTLLFMLNPMVLKTLGEINRLYAVLFAGTFLFQVALVFYFRIRTRAWRRAQGPPVDELESILFLVGAVHWAAVIFLHWTSNIDLFNYRLFAPGALLFMLGGIHHLYRRQSQAVFNVFAQCVAAMAIAAYGLHFPLKVLKHSLLDQEPSYAQNMDALQSRYADIPAGSAVMIANSHLNYLRPDLRILFPYFGARRMGGRVLFYSETFEELVSRAERMPYRHVFLDVRETIHNAGRVDPSFRVVAENNSRDSFVRIR